MQIPIGLIVVLIVVLLLSILLLRFRPKRKNIIVETIINIDPSGNHQIEFIPTIGIHSVDAIQLAISYLANVLFVTSGESLELQWPILKLVNYVSQWQGKELSDPQEYRDGLIQLVTQSRVTALNDKFAVAGGERYRVKVYRGRQTDYSVSNFSVHGYANNLSYSALLLYCQIAQKIDNTYLKLLHYSFIGLMQAFIDKQLTLSSNQMMAFLAVEYVLGVFPEPIINTPERASKHAKVTASKG
jgi:hypothetical protein